MSKSIKFWSTSAPACKDPAASLRPTPGRRSRWWLSRVNKAFKDLPPRKAKSLVLCCLASAEPSPKDLQGAVATLAETLTGVEGVEEAAIKVTIMASRLYLFGMQLLPLFLREPT